MPTTTLPKRPCVLVVDDNPMVRQAMAMLMKSIGWDVVEANHAEQALEQLAWKEFELAIIDFKMPDINGIQLTRQIHLRKDKKIPIVFIHSGYMTDKSQAEAMSAGVQAILEKPLGRSDLIDVLRTHGLPSSA